MTAAMEGTLYEVFKVVQALFVDWISADQFLLAAPFKASDTELSEIVEWLDKKLQDVLPGAIPSVGLCTETA